MSANASRPSTHQETNVNLAPLLSIVNNAQPLTHAQPAKLTETLSPLQRMVSVSARLVGTSIKTKSAKIVLSVKKAASLASQKLIAKFAILPTTGFQTEVENVSVSLAFGKMVTTVKNAQRRSHIAQLANKMVNAQNAQLTINELSTHNKTNAIAKVALTKMQSLKSAQLVSL